MMGCPPVPVHCTTCGSKLVPYNRIRKEISYDACTGKKTVKEIRDFKFVLYCVKCCRKRGRKLALIHLYPDHLYTCEKCGSHDAEGTYWVGLRFFEHKSIVKKRGLYGLITTGETHSLTDCSVCGGYVQHDIQRY